MPVYPGALSVPPIPLQFLDDQREFPQQKSQKPGAGFPIARVCAVLSLATGALCDLNLGPYQGKETGESALLRGILDSLDPGDVAVFDRYYCSFLMLAMLTQRELQFCTRLHQRRSSDFRRGKRLGKRDHLVTWTRPKRPAWMTPEQYEQIPPTMTLREVRFHVTTRGRRTANLTLITSLTDPKAFPAKEIARLYGFRWNVELDLRHLKQTLHLDHARCMTPDMVRRQLWVTLLAYNLIRRLIATAAALHDKQPRQIGFTLACQTVLSSWILLATGACRDPAALWEKALERIAANPVANRPGRIEPRVIKQTRGRYPHMHESRDELRRKLPVTK